MKTTGPGGPPAISAIVFDFDGVLADTEPLHFQAFQDTFDRRGWPFSENEYRSQYLALSDRDLLYAYAESHDRMFGPGEVAAILSEKSDAYRARLEAPHVLYPAAVNCVGRLRRRFPLAIASGSLRAEIRDILTAHNLLDAFSTIVAIDDVTHGKPDPESYRRAAERLGLAPAACVAVEDTRWGLEAARDAGLRTVGITHTTSRANLKAAEWVIDHLDELTDDAILAMLPA
jgi:beta-phosphoglucomutase